MKILITGGAGYIGSHTAVELCEAGYDVVSADNFSNSKPTVMERISKITGKTIINYNIDVCDKYALDALFEKEKPDAVIHFAGLKAVGESVEIPLKYYRNNIDATLTLLEVMKAHNVNIIVFSSSATVYGKPEKCPITEDMPTGGCSNPYGQTKYMIEQILKDCCVADSKLNAVLLRYFNPIGAHSSGLLCEDPNGIPNNLMPYILQVASGKRPYLNVYGDDYATKDGTGVRDYIHVVDLAKGHVAALAHAGEGKGVEIYNLGTGIGYSVLDVVNTFNEVNGLNIPYKITGRRPGDIDECYSCPDKAAAELGWKAQYGIKEMCVDAWNAQKHNPNGYEG